MVRNTKHTKCFNHFVCFVLYKHFSQLHLLASLTGQRIAFLHLMKKKNPPMKEKQPPVIIAVVGRKGGVGKTTTSLNLSGELANRGYQVLLVDLDVQGDATSALTREEYTTSTGQVLLAGGGLLEALVQTKLPTLWLLPTDDDLKPRSKELIAHRPDDFRFALRDVLAAEAGGFDFVVIDCPPSLEDITLIGLCAATHYLAPALPSYFSLKSLNKLAELTTLIQQEPGMNPNLRFIGLFFTDFNPRVRNTLHADIVAAANHLFPGKVMANVRTDKRLGDAQRDAIPAQLRTPESNAVADFQSLTDEVLTRL
jgi:chromosome partitioning protein